MADIVSKEQIDESAVQLSNTEVDAIGEILNISMGAAATTISTLLNKKTSITTPRVRIARSDDLKFEQLEPATGIEIKYTEGLDGSSFLIMKKKDVRVIVDQLIFGEANTDADAELDEMHISAISEIMNQMMGASCTALANLFGKNINISTPQQFDTAKVKEKISGESNDEYLVSVSFELIVEGILDSEFVTVLPVQFTKELVYNLMNADGEPEGGQPQEPKPAPEARPAVKAEEKRPQPEAAPAKPVAKNIDYASSSEQTPRKVSVQPLKFSSFDEETAASGNENPANLEMLMSVPLEVSVELGHTKKRVKEILELRHGCILELDKQAGDPVDVIVNGQLMARGDVVVVDDNFGVRITEILTNKETLKKFS